MATLAARRSAHEGIRELTLSPEVSELATGIAPEHRKKSIYETVVYDAKIEGSARFAFPQDLARQGVEPASLDLKRAELRFGVSDPRGIGANPEVSANRAPLRLQPGGGSSGGLGFFASVDASQLPNAPLGVHYKFGLRGNSSLTFAPKAGQTVWKVQSAWPHPNFGSDYLPVSRSVRANGFDAVYEIGNLALGESLVSTTDGASHDFAQPNPVGVRRVIARHRAPGKAPGVIHIMLEQPVGGHLFPMAWPSPPASACLR